MLAYDEARKIGVNACIDRIGREFVMRHRNNASSSFGDRIKYASCFVGVSDQPAMPMTDGLWLTSNKFPYFANCNVAYDTGEITFLECVLPDEREPGDGSSFHFVAR